MERISLAIGGFNRKPSQIFDGDETNEHGFPGQQKPIFVVRLVDQGCGLNNGVGCF